MQVSTAQIQPAINMVENVSKVKEMTSNSRYERDMSKGCLHFCATSTHKSLNAVYVINPFM